VAADVDILDVVVVGAGWAGPGVSYYLMQAGLRHRVFERARIGETWRTQLWDSFHLNTPNVLTVLPGDRYDGPDPEGFMTRDEFVTLLDDYAVRHRLPVQTGTPVTALVNDVDGTYALTTLRSTLRARNVVIASGNLNRPRRPSDADSLPGELQQMDSSDYRRPDALPKGAVLVVGSAQSGAQIAEDLALGGQRVLLAQNRGCSPSYQVYS
jgi:putative flavoprotein involved in K+ transport